MTISIPSEYLLRTSEDFGFSAVDETEVTQTVDPTTLETTVIKETVSTSSEAISRIEDKMNTILQLYNDGKLGIELERAQLQEQTSAKLLELEKMIVPLLVNLMRNPDKEYIYWPNRKDKIQDQINKVLMITRGTASQ
jgi:hypothetical protein